MTTLLDRLQTAQLGARNGRRTLGVERYRTLKAAALDAALRASNEEGAHAATRAVHAHLVRLLGLFALVGEGVRTPADAPADRLDAPARGEPAGRDLFRLHTVTLRTRLALEAELRRARRAER